MSRMMQLRAASAAAALVVFTGLPAAFAQDSAVVARVGDATITEEDIALAETDFASELAQVPEDRRRSILIDVLVDMELLAQGAREKGLDKTEEFERRVEFLRTRALRNEYVEQEILNSITPEELKAEYDRQVSSFQPQEEMRARHILVDTREQAEKIIADLKAGGSFEELAKQSKDGSGQNGGDLGFFSSGQMVEPFEKAVLALEPGAITETPVETQFGWHVIKLEEKRMSSPPPLEQVEDELRNVLLRQRFETVMSSLREKYPVEIVGAPAEGSEPSGTPAAPGAAGEGAPASPAAPSSPVAPAPAQPETGAQPQN